MHETPIREVTAADTNRRPFTSLPFGIWALGFVSLFMDVSSELVHSLLPVFMTSVLGAGMVSVGLIEGAAEATALITKLFSGAISDYLGKRKILAVLGYGLGAISKPAFPLATSISWVFTARFIDRVGKGIRGAPRDALVAEIAPPSLRGAAYGLRQSLDSVGAFVGPLAAILLMGSFANNIRTVLWFASVPAFLAVALLIFAVREPNRPSHESDKRAKLALSDAKRLPRRYWGVVALGAVFMLARFSEAFLILRAHDVGIGIGRVPFVMIVMNVVYAAAAYPAGIASDRFRARNLLIAGLALLIASDAMLAIAQTPFQVFGGAALWGLHMGATQGLFSKLIADTTPVELRGSAFGAFSLVSGIAVLLASVLAGALWNAIGPSATFIAGAAFAGVAAIGLLAYPERAAR